MTSGLIVMLVIAVALVAAFVLHRKRRKEGEASEWYVLTRPGCAKFLVDPAIPRATAEGMADLLKAVLDEVFPFARDTYAQAFISRHIPAPLTLPRWNETRIHPGQMSDRRWTAWSPGTGTWRVSIGCTPHLLAEEIHSAVRARLGDDVYADHSLYRVEGETVSSWIRERFPT